MFSLSSPIKLKREWRSWNGALSSRPEHYFSPASLDQLREVIMMSKIHHKTIRVVGAAHSFSAVARPEHFWVSLSKVKGLIGIDERKEVAEFYAGSTLRDANKALEGRGFCFENMGDVDSQSLAGAISTGTHGTGINKPSLSDQVEEFTVILASGQLKTIERGDELFPFFKISLGQLGVLWKVKFRVRELNCLTEKNFTLKTMDFIKDTPRLMVDNEYFEAFWFPLANKVLVKTINRSLDLPNFNPKLRNLKKVVLENYLLGALLAIGLKLRALLPFIHQLVTQLGSEGEKRHYPRNLFPSPRKIKFHESEYCLPMELFPSFFEELKLHIVQDEMQGGLPLKFRFSPKGEGVLNPAQSERNVYVSYHCMNISCADGPLKRFEELCLKYEGRPHWGKHHTLMTETLKNLYPQFTNFIEVKKLLDPNGIFTTSYFSELLGLPKGVFAKESFSKDLSP